jgi:hypothetical protein
MAKAMTYTVVEGCEQLPNGFAHREVAGPRVDQAGRCFVSTIARPRGVLPHIFSSLAISARGHSDPACFVNTVRIACAIEPKGCA